MKIFSLKNILIFSSILLVFFLILLDNLKVIPLQAGDFIFFASIALAFALYRPGWAFLFFIGTITLENINLIPENAPIAIRPYQIISALIIAAILIRFFAHRLNFGLGGWKWHDGLIILINISGFFSLINAPDKFMSFKLALVLASFSALYFLTRIYVKNIQDLKKIIPFFLASSVIIIFYGIWQNIRYLGGKINFEVMPGRPNSTFMEPDWLGAFVILVIAVLYGIIYYYLIVIPQIKDAQSKKYFQLFLYLLLAICYILLILTVSRSAWLGALAATFIFLFATLYHPENWRWKLFFKNIILIASAGIISAAAVYVFHLTNFQLFNRAQSTGTGQQKITISCDFTKSDFVKLPDKINDISELGQYGCRHINLEEIESEKAAGNRVLEIFRNDPNISIRSEIYKKSWQEIKKHPFLGIGWGSIGSALGLDERGSALNSSNLFLEVWLGAGFAGAASFAVLLLYALFKGAAGYYHAQTPEQKAVSIFIISSWFGLIVFNLFNAGIFLGFLWVWLGINFCNFYENRN